MAFIPFSGKIQIAGYAKAASTAIAVGDLMVFSSGYVTPAAATLTTPTAGVSLRKVVAADSDYAATGIIPLYQCTDDMIFLADVGAGTASIANVGVAYDLAAAGTVDLTDSGHKAVTVVGVIDASHVLVKINSNFEYVNNS